MKILLTGSNGFLGKYLYDTLSNQHSIFTLNRSNSDYNFNLGYDNILFEDSFDCVIHTAGKAHSIARTQTEEKTFFKINVYGTIDLLNALLLNGVPKYFIFISSVSVYGLISGEMVNENWPLQALDPYGKSKIEAEKIISEWCSKNGVVCTILRLPLVAGANPPGNLGAMIKGIKKGFYFNIAGGIARKSMVLASDVAKFIIKASKVGGTYHLTDGCHPSFRELSKNIADQLGKRKVRNMSNIVAKIVARFGDFLPSKFPINSDKLAKINASLTFDDSMARDLFDWDATPVLKGFKIDE